MARDTDEDWKGIAGEPYYGVFSHTEYFRDQLTPERLEQFWQTGRQEIAGQLDILRRHYGPFEPRSAIDFGCGVGRLTRAMAAIVDQAYGIDVAPLMLAEARKGAPANIDFRHDLPDGPVDWINSTIVFQHIHPANGIPLLARLLERLAPGGGITLQFGFYKERQAFSADWLGMDYVSWDGDRMTTLMETPPAAGTMMMYDYDLNQLLAMFHAAGIDRLSLQHSDHGGHHGAFILGRKG